MNDTQQEVVQETPTTSGKPNTMMLAGVVAVLAIVGLGAFMVLGQNDKAATSDTNSAITQDEEVSASGTTTQAASGSAAANANARIVAVEGANFAFKPNEITAKKGETVRIQLTSKDMQHDFMIDELNVKSTIAKAGETVTVEFTPDEVGEFEFYCSVGEHRKNGMVGKLIVTE